MTIVVFGASGKTGSLLVKEALTSGIKVIAYVRTRESIKLNHPDLKVVVGQLTEKDKLRSAIINSDACISTLGGTSLTKHSYEFIDEIDNIVSIMEEEKVKRFVYMSSFGVGNSRKNMSQPARFLIVDLLLRVPLADHNTNESRIIKSKLLWTIVRPGGLTNDAKTGKLKHGFENIKMKGSSSISRSNIAAFLLDQVASKDYLNRSIWVHD